MLELKAGACFLKAPETFAPVKPFLSYFFVKKYLLVGVSGMLWLGQIMGE